jgi:hypothetical protein
MDKTLIRLAPRKPRNPLVAPARMRKAGAHTRSGSAERLDQKRTLRQELRECEPPRPRP